MMHGHGLFADGTAGIEARGPDEAWARDALDALPFGVVLVEQQTGIAYANAAALALFGKTASEVHGRPLRDFADPVFAEYADARLAGAAAGQTLPETECRLQRTDGQERWVRCSGTVLAGRSPASGLRMAVTFNDVSAHRTQRAQPEKQAADVLRRQNWALNAYSRSVAAIVRPGEIEAQLSRICQALVDESPYELATIGIPLDAPGKPVRWAASAGRASGYLDGLKVSWAAEVPEGQGPGGRALRDGLPTIVDYVADAPVFAPWQQRLLRFGLYASVTVPCMAGGKVVAALGVYASVPKAFGPDELAVFQRLSDEVAFVINLDAERTQFRAAEARLAELVERGPAILFQSIVYPDRSEQIIYSSPNMAAITGYSMEFLSDHKTSWAAMTDPAMEDRWPEVREQALRNGKTQWEYPLRTADGRILRILSSSRAEPRGDGSWLLTGTMVDVTSQRAAEAELERAQRRLQLAVDAGPGALLLQRVHPDLSVECTFVSGAIERVTGYTAAETMSPEVRRAALDPDHVALAAASNARTLAMEPSELTFRYRAKSGGWRWLHAEVRPVERRDDGSVDEVVYLQDVTEQKEQQARALHSAELMMLGEMTTSMAHELNQPLAIMSMAAENAMRDLQDPARAPMVAKRLERIQTQAMRAAQIIEQLRVFGRSHEAGSSDVSLQDVVAGSLVLGKIKLRNAGVRLRSDVAARLYVRANALLLEQVLLNLISNACDAYDALPVPASRLELRIGAELVDGRVVMTVADYAGGIPEGILSRVFEPFFTTKGASKGTGVGLSFCYGVIADMKGTITAHNEAGGAVFTISLPAASPPG